MKKAIIAVLVIAAVFAFAHMAFAHSGGTDSFGGHHNWSDGSGSYHYH